MSRYFKSLWERTKIFTLIEILNYAYSFQHAIFHIFEEVKNFGFSNKKSSEIMKKGSIGALIISTFFQSEDYILNRNPYNNKDKDILMNMAKLSVAFSLCLTSPMKFITIRSSVLKMFHQKYITSFNNYLMTFITFLVSGL